MLVKNIQNWPELIPGHKPGMRIMSRNSLEIDTGGERWCEKCTWF